MSAPVALVTGASQGIGRKVAESLLADGYRVGVLARSRDKLRSLPQENCLTLEVDVRDALAVEQAVQELENVFGSPEFLLNNAGVYKPGSAEISLENFDTIIDTNLKGSWNVIHAVVPLMKTLGKGRIVNISSIVGVIAPAGVGVYSASKFGLRGLNESLFRELAPLGISVTSICPSWVATDMAAHSDIPDADKIQTDDIVETIRFLGRLSPGAAIPEIVIHCRSDIL